MKSFLPLCCNALCGIPIKNFPLALAEKHAQDLWSVLQGVRPPHCQDYSLTIGGELEHALDVMVRSGGALAVGRDLEGHEDAVLRAGRLPPAEGLEVGHARVALRGLRLVRRRSILL